MPDINMQVFEEAKRNQLVTEIDVQTQVALDDYQVQLSDIANPIQSQDNVVIDRYGEFLSHWNESLDFDTWVKISMEIAGKRILMLRGNSNVSSASNIHSVMESGSDTFESLDGTYWLTESGTPSIVSNKLTLAPGDWVTGIGNIPNKVIMEYRLKYSATSSYIPAIGAVNVHYSPPDWAAQTADAFRYQYWTGNDINTNVRNDGTRSWVLSYTADTNYHVYKIIQESTSSVKFYYDDVLKETMTTNVPNEDLFVTLDRSELSGAGTMYIDYIIVRKYDATEPTYSISTLKNISTALKSLGRAG